MYYKTRMKTYSRLRKTKKLGKSKLKYRNTKMRRKNSRKSCRKNKYRGGAPPKMKGFPYPVPPPSQSRQQPRPTTELPRPTPPAEQITPPPSDYKQQALTDNGIKYQAVDIFILTKRANKICIILFVPIDSETKKPRDIVNMPGGRCEITHPSLQAVASQELFEESACTIKISEQEFTNTLYYDLAGSGGGEFGKRRTYLVYIPDTADIETNYKNNLKKINTNRRSVPEKYRETNRIVFIPLQTIIDSLKDIKPHPKNKPRYPGGCNDFDNNHRNVDWRIFNIVYNLQLFNYNFEK